MDDLISRQAVIDALGERPFAWVHGEYEEGLIAKWESDVEAIRALPSAQPEPCEDAVSREAVIDVFYELWGTSLTRTVNAINDLPTVTPKQRTGKWIKKNGNLYCSKCGTKALFRMDKKILDYDYCESNFCPNCGMNMRGK